MIDRLATVRCRIDHGSVSLTETLCARDFGRRPLEVAEEFLLLPLQVCDGRDVFPRNHKNVHRRLRLEVGKCVAVIILVDGFRWDASIDNLAEDATHGEEFTRIGRGGR